MTRPRKPTTADCEECSRLIEAGCPCQRCVDILRHRREHAALDRRRAQWRRKNRPEGYVGSLHDLSCKGPSYCTCQPIAVYDRPQEDVA